MVSYVTGCSGADVEAVCNSTFNLALNRLYPDLLNVDTSANMQVSLTVSDFQRAVAERVGAAARETCRSVIFQYFKSFKY